MSVDLEQQLRDEIREEADAFEPSPDLERRINRRIDRRTGQARILAAAAISLAVIGVAAVGLAAAGQDERESIDMVDDHDRDPDPERDPTTTPSTTEPTERTTSTPTTTPTTTSTPETTTTLAEEDVDIGPRVGTGTPLHRRGIGPISAGNSIMWIESEGGYGVSIDPAAWEASGRTCGVFEASVSAHQYRAISREGNPIEDYQAMIIAIGGSDPTIFTEEGIHPGSTVDEVHVTYGEPTSIDTNAAGEQVLVYEQDGYAYGFRVSGDVVTDVRSGFITGFAEFEPCQ